MTMEYALQAPTSWKDLKLTDTQLAIILFVQTNKQQLATGPQTLCQAIQRVWTGERCTVHVALNASLIILSNDLIIGLQVEWENFFRGVQ